MVGCGDDARVPPTPPATFGAGFTDLPFDAPFTLVPPEPGTEDLSTGGFGDLDGDGAPEVIVSAVRTIPGRSAAVLSYDAAAGRLDPAPAVHVPAGMNPFAVVDLDGDGLADLVAQITVAWGRGLGEFEAPTTPAAVVGSRAGQLDRGTLADLDDDGWLDILAADRCCGDAMCRDLHPLLRTGPRQWTERLDLVTPDRAAVATYVAMALEIGGERAIAAIGLDCAGDRAPVFYRRDAVTPTGWPHFAVFDPTPADAHFRGSRTDRPSISSRAPMAGATGDLDGDGQPELAIAINPEIALFAGGTTLPLRDRTNDTFFASVASDLGRPMIPWGMAFLDLDRDGRLDLLAVHGDDTGAPFDPPERFIGPQYATAHWNGRGLAFADVTRALHLDRRGQWRSLAVGDLDADGDPDVLVGGQSELPRVYRNDVDTGLGNHGLALRLRGTTSNHLGIGARVTVVAEPGAPEQHYEAGAFSSPWAWSEPLVFVGLGRAPVADTVQIRWPSGYVQELHGLEAGRLHAIDEPSLVTLTPSSRHVAADGRSELVVLVTPRRPDGTPDDGARVEIAQHGGMETVAVAVTRTASGWEGRITAPAMPGTATLEITIEGTPLAVRPRVWWD